MMYSTGNQLVVPSHLSGSLLRDYLDSRLRQYDASNDIPLAILTTVAQDMDMSAPLPDKMDIKHDSMKYRVVSAMQKAIRRGHVEVALQCAAALHTHDDNYLWRRLGIICLEDLGLLGLELACFTLHYGGQKKVRQKYDSLRLTLYVVEQMCLSVKDRTFCEIAAASNDPQCNGLRENLFASEPVAGDLSSYLFDEHAPLGERFLIGKRYAGLLYKFENKKRQYVAGDRGTFFNEVEKSELPALCKLVTRLGVMKGAESLSVSIPIAWGLFKDDPSPELMAVVPMELDYSPVIAGLPSYAYDGHSLEGKRALAIFIKSCGAVRDWLDKHFTGDRQKFVKSAVFWGEGGLVFDRYLDSSVWRRAYAESMAARAREYGLSRERMFEFYKLVQDNLHILHAARRKALS